ncbi:MAG: hypothetical protein RLZZ471_1032 [Actinomycetota bacterium]
MKTFKNFLSGMNPWLPVFLTTFLFHVIRGAFGDALIFGTGCTILILDWKKVVPWHMPERPKLSKWVVTGGMLVAASVLFFSKRGGWQDIVLLLALAPIAISLTYYRDHGPKPSATKTMARTRAWWVGIAITMALCELMAYIWANVYKDDKSFPTISVLVNPILESPYGRSVFLVLWMLIGVGMLGIWRKKK